MFSDICSFCSNLILLVSSVLCRLSFFSINAVQGELGLENPVVLCSSLAARPRLRLEPNICRYGYSTFLQLPNSYTITKYFALYHIRSYPTVLQILSLSRINYTLLAFNIISIFFVFMFLFISSLCNKLYNYITENVL